MDAKFFTTKIQRQILKRILISLSMAAATMGFFGTSAYGAPTAPVKKKWTVLVYMNGHSNLDEYTTADINEMEAAGPNADTNILVQWASQSETQTHRLLIKKDTDLQEVTSPKVQSLPRVDMGDYRELQAFLEWAIQNYPAEHYFVDVWNHGNGWMERLPSAGFTVNNISYDDISGNSISIPDLGLALKAASVKAGKRIDIYGSDACLMNMAEVASELAPYVDTMVGSEEVEPMDGWQYEHFLNAWNAKPTATAHEIGTMLADTYIESYSEGYRGVTFSVLDLTQMENFDNAFSDFATFLTNRSSADAKTILAAAKAAEYYDSHTDYVDLMGFLTNLDNSNLNMATTSQMTALKTAFNKVVVYNVVFRKQAKGIALWIPPRLGTLTSNIADYRLLNFDMTTGWGSTLDSLHKAAAAAPVLENGLALQ